MGALAPNALTAMSLWFLRDGWAVLRREIAPTVPDLLWRVVRLGLVLALQAVDPQQAQVAVRWRSRRPTSSR